MLQLLLDGNHLTTLQQNPEDLPILLKEIVILFILQLRKFVQILAL